MLEHLSQIPAFWGFFGALTYAGFVLTAALWGEKPAEGAARKKALAEFALALIFGPIAAEGFGPTVAGFMWLKGIDHRAVFLTIGLSANYLWPLAVRALGGVVVKRIERGV